MAPVTRRSIPAARPAAAGTKPASSGYRGAAGISKMHEEEANHVARREAQAMNSNMPFRFFCPVGEEPREIVVVDYSMSEVFFRFEHGLKDKRTGKWNVFSACIAENALCPVCKEAERPAYFAMYLTVLDLTPYVNKDGIEVPWSKKLLVVKAAQQKKLSRLADRHGGNLRGMVLAMTRDGEKDASIGNDIEFVEFMNEDDLATYETTYEYKDATGKKQVKEIIGHEPFDYDALFPLPTEQQLRAIVGGRPEPGSRDDEEAALGHRRISHRPGSSEWDEPAAAVATRSATRPATRAAAPAPAAPPARRARPAVIDPDDRPDAGAEEGIDDEADAPPPRSAAPAQRRTGAAPAARRAPPVEAEYVESEEIGEGEEGAFEDSAPAQPSRRAAPTRAARPDPEQDSAPARSGAQSLVDRRRALRR